MFIYINTYTQDRSYTQYTCTYIPNIKVCFSLISQIKELQCVTHSSAHCSFSSNNISSGNL